MCIGQSVRDISQLSSCPGCAAFKHLNHRCQTEGSKYVVEVLYTEWKGSFHWSGTLLITVGHMCNVINYRGRKWKQSYFLYHSWIFSAVLCGQLVGWKFTVSSYHLICLDALWLHSHYSYSSNNGWLPKDAPFELLPKYKSKPFLFSRFGKNRKDERLDDKMERRSSTKSKAEDMQASEEETQQMRLEQERWVLKESFSTVMISV